MTTPINTDYWEGPPVVYVPIVKHPREFLYTHGPIGYEQVESVVECPICVKRSAGDKSEKVKVSELATAVETKD